MFHVLLRFTLILGSFLPLIAMAQDASPTARIRGEGVKLRAQASVKAKSVSSIKDGTDVVVLDQKSGWVRIRAGKFEGWVEASKLVFPASPQDPVQPGPSVPSKTGIRLYQDQPIPDLESTEPVAHYSSLAAAALVEASVVAGGADLRAYPGTQAAVLLHLAERTLVSVIERSDRWIKCDVEGLTGWIEREKLALRGARTPASDAAAIAALKDAELREHAERISDQEMKEAANTVLENERRLRASISALDARSPGGTAAQASATGEHVLHGLETDALRLNSACEHLAGMAETSDIERDRIAANSIANAGRATLKTFRDRAAQAQSAPPSAVLMYGGQISAAIGSHTRTAIYDYSSSSPTVQASGWMNTPGYGNVRARMDWTDDVVTTRFTRLNTGADWRLPQGTQQWSARINYFRYDDDVTVNTYGMTDLHAGWEQLRQNGPALFARLMYQGKAYSETQPQDFSAVSLNAGVRSMAPYGQAYEINVLNRYQTSDDMGLNFNMLTAYGAWRGESGFSFRPSYEGYLTLADSGGTFLNYHRPGLELRWSKPEGITDYGVRIDYRLHPDAENLTFGIASLFAGHHEQGMIGTNWDALLMYQLNNGTRNPSFMQGNADARHTTRSFFIGANAVTRYMLAEDNDSISQHYTDLYLNPGVILEFKPVRLEAGPFIGATFFLNNKTMTIKDNLNNSARIGLSAHAMAAFGALVNVRAWGEYERSFYFVEDPYVGRKREPMRLRLGAEANVAVYRSLSLFGRVQTYSIDNDTGIMINLPSGQRERDKIDDSLVLVGLRYHF